MRVELKKLMEHLGVDRTLAPYETQPWFLYDDAKGVTCSAEVRMGPGGDDIEAEIQLVYDEGRMPEPAAPLPVPAGEPPPPPVSTGLMFEGGPIQIMRMRALPLENLWTPKELRIKGQDYKNKVFNWEEKSCNFFRACIEALQMSEIPNIDDLIEKELGDEDDWGGGKKGRIGRKAPKIKPAQLLGLKKGI